MSSLACGQCRSDAVSGPASAATVGAHDPCSWAVLTDLRHDRWTRMSCWTLVSTGLVHWRQFTLPWTRADLAGRVHGYRRPSTEQPCWRAVYCRAVLSVSTAAPFKLPMFPKRLWWATFWTAVLNGRVHGRRFWRPWSRPVNWCVPILRSGDS